MMCQYFLLLTTLYIFVAQGSFGNINEICCQRGEYEIKSLYDGRVLCSPCKKGTFSDDQCHHNTDCKPCSTATLNNHEVVLQNCTVETDSVIGCKPGYFQKRIHGDIECYKCSICREMFEARPCNQTTDTVCCPGAKMRVIQNGRGGYTCQVRCSPGEYLNGTLARCLPCPARTYMSAADHTYSFCWPCFNYLNHPGHHNFKLSQTCTDTQNEQIECHPGYYLRQLGDPKYNEAECIMCSVCSLNVANKYEARPCNGTLNAVCCPAPNMKLDIANTGYGCINAHGDFKENSTVPVSRETSQSIKPLSNASKLCNNCPFGNYMDDGDHSYEVETLPKYYSRDNNYKVIETSQDNFYKSLCKVIGLVSAIVVLFLFLGANKFA